MRCATSNIFALLLLVATACGTASPKATTTPTASTALREGLQIKLTTIYVDDQEKALQFYTDVLGFVKKDDVVNEGFRWLTVMAPGDTNGTALQLALNNDPAAKAFQEAMFKQSQPAIMFYTKDAKADVARIRAKGAEFTMPLSDVTYAWIATLKDGVGNLVQITQLQ
ncbi:MAG: VOC family protein [Kofleriaceae bacterium]|nr:VOC family protein [Kofleriaceae bacterium]